MPVRIGAGASEEHSPRQAAIEAAVAARGGLQGAHADLAVVFASGAHLSDPEGLLEGVHEALVPGALIGCGAGGVLAGGREHEQQTAVAVWAAALDGGSATTFAVTAEPAVDEGFEFAGLPALEGSDAVLLLADPGSLPVEPLLAEIGAQAPGLPVLGGLASAVRAGGEALLFHGGDVVGEGGIGAALADVPIVPCVSQGAEPIGPEMTITAAEGNIVHELAGRPALEKLRSVIDELGDEERAMLGGGLLIGLVIDAAKPEYVRGDFLVRTLIGADEESQAIAVGALVEPGQVVRLHVRDADSADRDLRAQLAARARELAGPPAGALMFSCNGRGRGMFGVVDPDAAELERALDGAPAAGFFAAGEIGPIGSQSFVHGFTATVAVFGP
jgi:small ligand-binding sensory domain FIST